MQLYVHIDSDVTIVVSCYCLFPAVPSRMAAFPRMMQLKEYKGECFTAKQK